MFQFAGFYPELPKVLDKGLCFEPYRDLNQG